MVSYQKKKLREIYNFNQMSPVEIYKLLLTGRIKKFPDKFLDQPGSIEHAIQIIKFLIEDILNWSDDEIKKNLNIRIFKEYRLAGMLGFFFKTNSYRAINTVYPGKFKEWEFQRVSSSFWTKENVIKITKWLIEEKLQWSDTDIKKNWSQKTFFDNGLGNMLSCKIVNHSPFKAIELTYPGRFKEWELGTTPVNFWTLENGIKVVKWLIEEKLQWSDDEIKQKISHKVFIDHGLVQPMNKYFGDSPFRALDIVYPGRFKEWELPVTHHYFWTLETGIIAIKWLIEEKLQWTDADIKRNITHKVFADNGLAGLLVKYFKGSPFLALNAAYPGKFKEWELPRTPMRFWKKPENIVKAIRWLIEEKLQWPDEDIKNISCNTFKSYGLGSVLQKKFGNNPFLALDAAYPGKFNPQDFRGGRMILKKKGKI